MSVNFRSYRMRIVCEECGSSCPVNHPVTEITCTACGHLQPLPVDYLREHIFGLTLRRLLPLEPGTQRPLYFLGNAMQFSGSVALAYPSCHVCSATADLSRVPPGTTADIPCLQCGALLGTYPPPAWMLAMNRSIVQIFVPRPRATASNARPIALACPECGAKLRVSPEDRRLVPCKFCETDVFLPEEVWRAFHPVQRRTAWFVCFSN